jgi:outer membrane receptor protein involved in Fe transport
MSTNISIRRAVSYALWTSVAAAAAHSSPIMAAENQDMVAEVVVTGSRIQRQDYVANSPVITSTAEQIVENADVTLDTYLNTLPQVNPAGGTTSNNPGNGGQSNIDLRGLGANRNIVLFDGRRAMPSASDMTVDLNTIPQALIESIEIVTGGAGAVYGADAVAGAVNIKLRENYEGLDFRYNFSNSTEYWDAEEYQVSGLGGMNFADGRGNFVIGADYSKREGMIKSQRAFAAQATSTTSYLPEGLYIPGANGPDQTAIDALFGRADYGSNAPGSVLGNLIGFNTDRTLFSRGVFNSPRDVVNFRYPNDLNINANLFPDLYSYNFDSVNILTLPLERKSGMGKFKFEFEGGVEVFASAGYTEYDSTTALAPTPFPTVGTKAPGEASAIQATSSLVRPGRTVSNNLVIPLNNQTIPDDLRTLLAQRTGTLNTTTGLIEGDPNLIDYLTPAAQPIMIRTRTLTTGLRQSAFNNEVLQYTVGARGPLFGDTWKWEAYASQGKTEITETQTGNIDTQRVIDLVAMDDSGASVCDGGLNFFGRNPLSAECAAYITVPPTVLSTEFKQRIVQGFVTGEIAQLPAGPMSLVVGAEGRWFDYDFDPGNSSGPVSGLNAQNPAKGNNNFQDLFLETLIPLVNGAPAAKSLELSLGYRFSKSEFEDEIADLKSDSQNSNAYKVELSWVPVDSLRVRTSYQRAVRAPNFDELFDGGGSAPQYFDPCSVGTAKRTGADAADMRRLCQQTGVGASVIDGYVQTPGNQISITTAGNIDLEPETADTVTIGLVFTSPWEGALAGLQGSLDYYSIDISDPIIDPSPNIYVAACYNYYGDNPTYSATNPFCGGIVRGGGDVLGVDSVDTDDGVFPGINGGSIKTDGLDLQLNYSVGLPKGELGFNLAYNYLLSFKQSDRPGLPALDYAGTVSYFGAGLGTSFPEQRANLTGQYAIGPFAVQARLRWIGDMENRAAVQFPGETFKGVPSISYLDLSASWKFMDKSMFRIGMNNVMDKQPPAYAPNVQSGTDPSTYDVIGRRIFGQISIGF